MIIFSFWKYKRCAIFRGNSKKKVNMMTLLADNTTLDCFGAPFYYKSTVSTLPWSPMKWIGTMFGTQLLIDSKTWHLYNLKITKHSIEVVICHVITKIFVYCQHMRHTSRGSFNHVQIFNQFFVYLFIWLNFQKPSHELSISRSSKFMTLLLLTTSVLSTNEKNFYLFFSKIREEPIKCCKIWPNIFVWNLMCDLIKYLVLSKYGMKIATDIAFIMDLMNDPRIPI